MCAAIKEQDIADVVGLDYLVDPAISFCAIGDANSDTAPLQVSCILR